MKPKNMPQRKLRRQLVAQRKPGAYMLTPKDIRIRVGKARRQHV